MIPTHTRFRLIPLVLPLVLGVVAGCGRDGTNEAATTALAPTSTSTTTAPPPPTSAPTTSAPDPATTHETPATPGTSGATDPATTVVPTLDSSVASAAGDGGPDPDGRIAYGVIMEGHERSDQLMALYAMDVDGSDLVQLTEGNSAFPAWAPDGSRLAFGLAGGDGSVQLATIGADGTDLRVLTTGPGIHSAPSWSPDGSWIAYEHSPLLPHEPGFGTVLYRIDADGSNPGPLAGADIPGGEPKVSPDGESVLYQLFGGPQEPLVIRDLATGAEEVVLAAGGHNPAWSPDGSAIVVQTDAFTPGWIWGPLLQIPVDGPPGERAELHQPTASSGGFKPVFSPDGKRIAFGCGRDARTPEYDEAICVMNADGSGVEILVDTPGRWDNEVSWGRADA